MIFDVLNIVITYNNGSDGLRTMTVKVARFALNKVNKS